MDILDRVESSWRSWMDAVADVHQNWALCWRTFSLPLRDPHLMPRPFLMPFFQVREDRSWESWLAERNFIYKCNRTRILSILCCETLFDSSALWTSWQVQKLGPVHCGSFRSQTLAKGYRDTEIEYRNTGARKHKDTLVAFLSQLWRPPARWI